MTPRSSLLLAGLGALVAAVGAGAALAAQRVTIDDFTRAEADYYFKKRVDAGCFGKLCQERGPSPVDRQGIVRENRDTPYSMGVFDLTSPVTIIKPDTGKRFQSMVVINEDHYIKLVAYDAGSYTLSQDKMGSRYVQVVFRTFMDPNDPDDMAAGHAAQDQIKVIQPGPGKFEITDWNQDQREKLQDALMRLAPFVPDSRRVFGDKDEVDPVRHLIGTAGGYGGNRERDALYLNVNPKATEGGITELCGARPETCPAGMKMGDAISPPGGWKGGGMQMLVDASIDPAGNVWVSNNWQDPKACYGTNEANSTRCGGQGMTVFYGMAKPVKSPQIGPAQPW